MRELLRYSKHPSPYRWSRGKDSASFENTPSTTRVPQCRHTAWQSVALLGAARLGGTLFGPLLERNPTTWGDSIRGSLIFAKPHVAFRSFRSSRVCLGASQLERVDLTSRSYPRLDTWPPPALPGTLFTCGLMVYTFRLRVVTTKL